MVPFASALCGIQPSPSVTSVRYRPPIGSLTCNSCSCIFGMLIGQSTAVTIFDSVVAAAVYTTNY